MTCPRCHAENPAGMKFCGQCAAPLAAVCPSCGVANPSENKFCGQCAASLGAGPVQTRFPTPDSYTPKHLAERIITSKAALEGERKQVTVLFADLKGSMELLADRDPEDARRLLDPVLEHMIEAVHRYEGTVNQVMGDGIMALFGAPIAHEDHAVRACYAALRMQESVKRYAEGVRRVEGIPVRIRVGLNSGEVVVRAIGSDLHMDYTAVGQTTHLAARMEQFAAPDSIALTPATLALAEGFVEVRSLGPTSVKGLAEPVEIYELTGASAVRSRLQATAARGLTKFVGRSTEMAQLQDALDLAGAGRGQVAAVVGEPGIGKSRLLWEFTHSRRTTGCLVIEAASVSYGKATPYFPVIELLKNYFSVEPRDDTRRVREKVMGKLLSLDRALEASLPPLLALLDLPVEEGQWNRLDPIERRRRTFDGVKRLLLRESHVQPLVVEFEDLHWIDAETQALLDSLIESLPTTRILLLVNYRPEYQHAWGGKTYYRQIRIDALSKDSADELLDALLGRDAELSPLKRMLIERTEGNPFFLEETVRSLVEIEALSGTRGGYRLTRTPEAIHVPATAQAILSARIDRLDPGEKRLLQAAAVIGKDVPIQLLEDIAEEPDRLVPRLARLQAAEFLYEIRLFPDAEYTFKHALTHEVAYGGLLNDQRKTLHAKVLAAIEMRSVRTEDPFRGFVHPVNVLEPGTSRAVTALEDQAERLVHHAVRAEEFGKVARYGYWAGRRAAERCAYRDAITYFDQALDATVRMPDGREAVELGVDIRMSVRRALIPLGQGPAAFARLSEAAELVRRLDDPVRLTSIMALVTHQLWLAGRTTEAQRYADMVLRQAEALADDGVALQAYLLVGQACQFWGDWPRAERLLSRVISEIGDDHGRVVSLGNVFAAVAARALLAAIRTEQGQFDEALRLGSDAVRIAESMQHPFSVGYATIWLAIALVYRGDVERAALLCQRGLALGEDTGIRFYSPFFRAGLGYAAMLSGRVAEAVPLIRAGKTEQLSMGFRYALAAIGAWLAEALALSDQHVEAAAEAKDALALAIETGERPAEMRVYRVLGAISPSREEAVEWYKRGISLAREIGAKPQMAHGHAGLAKLYRRMGDEEQAGVHFTTAAAMYREMGLTFWLEKAESEMRSLA